MDPKIMKAAQYVAAAGAINVGLGAFGFNLVDMLAKAISQPMVGTVVYVAIGLSGLLVGKSLLKK